MFLNATLQHTCIVNSIYPTLSTYEEKYIVFKRIGEITQSFSNLYIRDNIIFNKSLDPNGRPIFYFVDPGYQFAYDPVTNQVISRSYGNYNRLNYTDILNETAYFYYITYIGNGYDLVGAYNGWFYYIEGFSAPRKIRRFNYNTSASQDFITGITTNAPIKYIQIDSTLYIWFQVNVSNYRLYKIDMTSPSTDLYVDIPSNIVPLFFDIPANNIFDNTLNLLEFDFVNHTYTSRRIIESTDTSSIIAINDSGIYKVLPNEEAFEYDSAEMMSSNHDSPYVDKTYLTTGSSLTKIRPTSTKYRSTYSIYKLVYASELSLDDPKTLETTIR
jgi:hypothetical protein